MAPGIVVGIHVDGRRSVGNLYVLGFDLDVHGHVQPERLIGHDHVVVLIQGESRRGDGQDVFARRQALEFVIPWPSLLIAIGDPVAGVI